MITMVYAEVFHADVLLYSERVIADSLHEWHLGSCRVKVTVGISSVMFLSGLW